MENEKWQKIKEVFNAVVELSESERAPILENQEDEIRKAVEKLINAHEKSDDFISEPAVVAVGAVDPDAPDFYIGKQIDDYLILKEIGHGGMGTVYLASRKDESFDKRVAIKLIKRGMDTNAVLKRFVMERKILAQFENPNIASLLDGGSTSDGLPYLVMEYIEGLPVTKFCDLHQFGTFERLELFRKICAAVSYAHQNLVVHRDLKPSNILVTENGEPKLLDFGIAKLLNPDWSLDTTDATATMFRIMTPDYASPEQLKGLPITTSSDVYSLGVVLYELLTGERPVKIDSNLPDEVAKIVLTEEPVRPSYVISHPTIVENETDRNRQHITDGSPDHKLHIANRKSLKGDLDNIILKALRKEPERRYQSVQEFSEDIRRHLAGLPVTATADTSVYRIGKFVKRHRIGVLVSMLFAITLVSATAITTWQAVVAKRERAKTQQRFDQVRKLANTILFDYQDRIKEMPGATEVREKMVTDSLEYLDNLANESDYSPDLQRELASAYRKVGDIQGDSSFGSNLGKTGSALDSYQKALAIQQKIVSENGAANVEDNRMLAGLMIDIAGQYENSGDLENRERYARSAIEIFQKIAGETPGDTKSNSDLAKAMWTLASAVRSKGDLDDAFNVFGHAAEIYEKLAAKNPDERRFSRNSALTYKNMGGILEQKKDFAGAQKLYEKALSVDEKNAEAEPNNVTSQMDLSFSYGSIATASFNLNNFEAAIENCRKKLAIQEKIVDLDAKNAFAKTSLALTFRQMGIYLQKLTDSHEAEESFKTSIKMFEQLSSADPTNAKLKGKLADSYSLFGEFLENRAISDNSGSAKLGQLREAQSFEKRSLEIFQSLKAQNALDTANEESFADASKRLKATEDQLAKHSRK